MWILDVVTSTLAPHAWSEYEATFVAYNEVEYEIVGEVPEGVRKLLVWRLVLENQLAAAKITAEEKSTSEDLVLLDGEIADINTLISISLKYDAGIVLEGNASFVMSHGWMILKVRERKILAPSRRDVEAVKRTNVLFDSMHVANRNRRRPSTLRLGA